MDKAYKGLFIAGKLGLDKLVLDRLGLGKRYNDRYIIKVWHEPKPVRSLHFGIGYSCDIQRIAEAIDNRLTEERASANYRQTVTGALAEIGYIEGLDYKILYEMLVLKNEAMAMRCIAECLEPKALMNRLSGGGMI